jgi:hypothetical protein
MDHAIAAMHTRFPLRVKSDGLAGPQVSLASSRKADSALRCKGQKAWGAAAAVLASQQEAEVCWLPPSGRCKHEAARVHRTARRRGGGVAG